MGSPICHEGEWPMAVSGFCDLKSEGYFQIVLAIVVQERYKDHPATVTEVFDVITGMEITR